MSLTHYLRIGSQCWGMSTSPGLAVAAAKRNWFNPGRAKPFAYDLWNVSSSTWVDEMGTMRWDPEEGAPIILKQVRFDLGYRTVKTLNMDVKAFEAYRKVEVPGDHTSQARQ